MTSPARLRTFPVVRVLICGAGNRGFPKDPKTALYRGWFESLRRAPGFDVVGVQSASQAGLDRVKTAYPLDGRPMFLDLGEAIQQTACDAVLICSSAEAHAVSAMLAVSHGCHVLIEKPVVTALADGLRLSFAAREKGVSVGVIQNWRAKSTGRALRRAVLAKRIGQPGAVFFRYIRDREQLHLPDYLFEESYPLLHAMAVHHFDLFRFVLGENIVFVEGSAFTPPWSRYKSPPSVNLRMQTESGIPISYLGTFASLNSHIPQESLIIDGSAGSLSNDSSWGEPPVLFSAPGFKAPVDLTEGESRSARDQYDRADDFYLADFREAIHMKRAPFCGLDDNIWTLASIEAAARACSTGKCIDVKQLLEETLSSLQRERKVDP